MNKKIAGAMIVVLMGVASGTEAQVSWDVPSFLGPRPGSDIGIYLVDPDAFGADLGLQGIWRTTGGANLELRVGYLDAPDGILQLGAATWGPVVVEGEDFPLDIAWTVGGGVSVDGLTTVSVPGGLSIGHTFDLESVAIQVYGHPRVALLIYEHPISDDLELDLEGQFDLGADFFLTEGLTLRVGASLGDYDALGIGLAWRQ